MKQICEDIFEAVFQDMEHRAKTQVESQLETKEPEVKCTRSHSQFPDYPKLDKHCKQWMKQFKAWASEHSPAMGGKAPADIETHKAIWRKRLNQVSCTQRVYF